MTLRSLLRAGTGRWDDFLALRSFDGDTYAHKHRSQRSTETHDVAENLENEAALAGSQLQLEQVETNKPTGTRGWQVGFLAMNDGLIEKIVSLGGRHWL